MIFPFDINLNKCSLPICNIETIVLVCNQKYIYLPIEIVNKKPRQLIWKQTNIFLVLQIYNTGFLYIANVTRFNFPFTFMK